jgi:hypothetical protein
LFLKTMSAIHIIGKLADNPRGKRLQKYLAASLSIDRPEGTGICLAGGQDYQAKTPAEQRSWLAWAAHPGNALLLVPPFQTAVRHEPNNWEISSLDGPPAFDSSAHQVLQLTQQEISASLTRGLAPTMNPLIDGGTRMQLSGLFRKRPDSGIFAATVVPVWSLALADHIPALLDWLSEWKSLAGRPSIDADFAELGAFEPSQLHYSLMLYLASGSFPDRAEALAALEWNDTFDFSGRDVGSLLDDMTAARWVSNATLTDLGRNALMTSPYRAFAETYLNPSPTP